MRPITISYLTPDNRPWRIDWFGELLFPCGINRYSQARIHVSISPLVCDPTDQKAILLAASTDTNEQRQKWIPVSMLPYVKVGDIWQEGRCIHSPEYQQELFMNVDIPKSPEIIKSGLSINREFVLPLINHPWHRLATQSYCVSVILPDAKKIVIPCIELIRFYFGSSSSLLHKLFTTQIFFEPLWRDFHYDRPSKRLHLKLAAGISGASASDIGRIALNKDAHYAARRIFDSCLLSLKKQENESIYTYTGFPFTGNTNLALSGKWLPHGLVERSTFVVYRIRSCSHPFPFASLAYEVADDVKIRSQKLGPINQSTPANTPASVGSKIDGGEQTLANEDPGKSKSKKEHRIKESARFPDLLSKPVWRERYDTVDEPGLILKNDPVNEKVGVGSSFGNSNVRSIDVVAESVIDISADDSSVPVFVRNGIKKGIKDTRFKSDKTTAKLLTLTGNSHPVFPLPHMVDENGEIDPVSFYLDVYEAQRLRRACFVEINEDGKRQRRLFIVEAENASSELKVMTVKLLDLQRAMKRLIDLKLVKPLIELDSIFF